MSIKVNGKKYYWSGEACELAGISKNTYLRWVKEGTFADTKERDRRGWRLFSDGDLFRLKEEVNKTHTTRVSRP